MRIRHSKSALWSTCDSFTIVIPKANEIIYSILMVLLVL
ncbi:hypothetical protein L914_14542 [Phytophthora nicotianae]|uniref:Uncharacterized protein n=1 Tax=Phytophthora nicotianae TaxID=4792 RepID=W2MUL4_PHYNI|nr:hypothetical protein L916_14599 [Phytophthora nicotianae]ETM39303.1 hypothetical protein L914_14542 [Phytophthora nicotianae]